LIFYKQNKLQLDACKPLISIPEQKRFQNVLKLTKGIPVRTTTTTTTTT
jgi:hypothetical protein